jgi:hypothetical protein
MPPFEPSRIFFELQVQKLGARKVDAFFVFLKTPQLPQFSSDRFQIWWASADLQVPHL